MGRQKRTIRMVDGFGAVSTLFLATVQGGGTPLPHPFNSDSSNMPSRSPSKSIKSSKSSKSSQLPVGVVDAVVARQADKDRVLALRDRVCAGKPGAADEYRLALSARCTPVAGRALEVAERKKRERRAAAAVAAKKTSTTTTMAASSASSAKGSASTTKAASAKAVGIQIEKTKEEIEYLKKRLKAMGPGDGAIDANDVRMCILIARVMSLTSKRREHPDVMERFVHVTEKAGVRGAEAHFREIFEMLEQLLEMEIRSRTS